MISTPERWYMLWNWALVTYAIVLGLIGLTIVLAGLMYFLGPIMVARGLQRAHLATVKVQRATMPQPGTAVVVPLVDESSIRH